MRTGPEKLCLIGCFGEVDNDILARGKNIGLKKVPGSLPDVLDGGELIEEIQRNREFIGGIVVLANYACEFIAAQTVAAIKRMGIEKVHVEFCA